MINKEEHYKQIVRYYEQSEVAYREGWDLNHSMALHGGYWDSKATTFRKALKRLNEVMAENISPREGHYILDAGCGVGGSSIFLANTYKTKVLGITLCEQQLEKAKRNAVKHKVDRLIEFQKRDYIQTGLPDETFEAVWAIESVCHALDKSDFIAEAYRVLKPGGKLILVDYFLKREPANAKEKKDYAFFMEAFACENLANVSNFRAHLEKAGFKDIQTLDKTANFRPNLSRLRFLGGTSVAYTAFLRFLGIRRESQVRADGGRSALLCSSFFKNGMLEYYMFCATK